MSTAGRRLVWLALVLPACDGGDAQAEPRARTDAGAFDDSGVEAGVDLSVLGNVAMDSLSTAELEALCLEAEHRSNPCLEQAILATTTPASCEKLVAACESNQDAIAAPNCTGIELGPSGTCTATVDEFLACMDAWMASLSCDVAQYQALPPAECLGVAERCQKLSSTFLIDGDPWPCTPEESDYVAPAIGDRIYGTDGCLPEPARFVVLGDSIASCTGPTSTATCAPYLIVDALRAGGAGGLEVEMHAWPGSKTADLRGQAEEVVPGPGHVFVWIFAIGNDLLGELNFDAAYHVARYAEAFDYFSDTSLFPDGATFLLNTQYEVWDGCDAPGATSGYSPELIAMLTALNQSVFIDVAQSRADAMVVDMYTEFLGHAQNANISGCPYCTADNTRWIDDGLHPNDAGHARMAAKWIYALEGAVGQGCSAP